VPETLPPLVLLHEDHDLVAVAKPAGEPVIPARGESARDCVQRRLERQVGGRLWVVHRIDRDASGVVVFARNADAHRELSLAFEHRQVEKSYTAWASGGFATHHLLIDTPLHEARKGKTRPAAPGEAGSLPSVSEVDVERVWRREGATVSRVSVRPRTGRHHQIRVHMRSVEAPLLFDALYGKGIDPAPLADAPARRLALHARRLVVPAPGTEVPLVFEAPLPPDLVELDAWLEDTWVGAER
jgi:tRNA pseudouridine32 synthase/23S rRNA pseudouridine746 synthase